VPGCLVVPADTSQITFVSSVTFLGWQYDYYQNNAYDCAVSGKQTFVVGGWSAHRTRSVRRCGW